MYISQKKKTTKIKLLFFKFNPDEIIRNKQSKNSL